MSEASTTHFSVGEAVRVELSRNRKRQRRGVIATLSAHDEACVLLLHPREAAALGAGNDSIPTVVVDISRGDFVSIDNKDDDNDIHDNDDEVTVPLEQVHCLLPFEKKLQQNDDYYEKSSFFWKSCGDTLMKLGDAPSAVSYYERALRGAATEKLQIGSTVFFQMPSKSNKEGRGRDDNESSIYQVWLAEVDCIDEDDDNGEVSVDVTVLARFNPFTNQRSLQSREETIRLQASDNRKNARAADLCPRVVLNLSMDDYDDTDTEFLQGRILLNLTRCLLQLATELREQHRDALLATAWIKSSILSTTLVQGLVVYHYELSEKGDEAKRKKGNDWHASALLLRSKAWLLLGQYVLALADLEQKPLRASDSAKNQKEVLALEKEILRQKEASSKQTRIMVKEMCQWIDSATKDDNKQQDGVSRTSHGRDPSYDGAPTDETKTMSAQGDDDVTARTNTSFGFMDGNWLTILLIFVAAMAIQKFLS